MRKYVILRERVLLSWVKLPEYEDLTYFSSLRLHPPLIKLISSLSSPKVSGCNLQALFRSYKTWDSVSLRECHHLATTRGKPFWEWSRPSGSRAELCKRGTWALESIMAGCQPLFLSVSISQLIQFLLKIVCTGVLVSCNKGFLLNKIGNSQVFRSMKVLVLKELAI